MKKVMCLILCIVMSVVVLAGCGATANNNASKTAVETNAAGSSAAEQGTAEQETSGQKTDLTPITFTLFRNTNNPDQDLTSETPVTKKVKELTGVTIEWQETTAGDYTEKIALMCATGDYPDLIAPSTATPMLYDAGAILKLNDLIDKYGPNIKKFFGPEILKKARWNLSDKEIYYFPGGGIGEVPNAERQDGYFIQLAALKDLGYPKIVTLTDYENAVKTYKDKNPTIDGKASIGMTLCFDSWHGLFSGGMLEASYAAGQGYRNNDWEMFTDLNTHKSIVATRTPEFKEAWKWYNHMNAIGLIDPESYVQKFDQYLAKISQGRVIGFGDDIGWHATEAIRTLTTDKKYDRLYAPMPATINADTKFGAYNQGSWVPAFGVCITTSCKDPVRATQFFDWLCTDEAQILNNWGLEGVNYTVENGQRVISPEEWTARTTDPTYFKRTGISNFTFPLPERGIGTKDPSGQFYKPDNTKAALDAKFQPENDALKAYGIQFWQDLFPAWSTIPESPWGIGYLITFPSDSKGATIRATCENITNTSLVKAMLCKPSEFDSVWTKYMEDLKAAGVEEYEKEKDILVERKIRLYTED